MVLVVAIFTLERFYYAILTWFSETTWLKPAPVSF